MNDKFNYEFSENKFKSVKPFKCKTYEINIKNTSLLLELSPNGRANFKFGSTKILYFIRALISCHLKSL